MHMQQSNVVIFVIDVMNIVTCKDGSKKNYSFFRLELLLSELSTFNVEHQIYLVVPSYLRKVIDNKNKYTNLLESKNYQLVEFAPKKGIENDNYFIQIAQKTNGYIITNDKLSDCSDRDINEVLLHFNILKLMILLKLFYLGKIISIPKSIIQ